MQFLFYFAKAGHYDARERKALLAVCECGCLSGLVPWLYLQNPMYVLTGTDIIKKKNTKEKGFTTSYSAQLWTNCGFLYRWDIVCAFYYHPGIRLCPSCGGT